MYARVLHGARLSLLTGLAPVAVALVIGSTSASSPASSGAASTPS
jgi:ABC-type dipeptide/oligopeptide/nickel transport system permease subunit